MPLPSLCLKSAVELGQAIANGDTSSVEVTEAFFSAIRDFNDPINAVVTLDEEGALKTAAAIDAEAPSGKPLAGVPFLAKDLDITAGIRTTFGSRLQENYVPKWDMTHIARLKEAGCVLLGKTNTPEDGVIPNTYNDVFGITRNPWNLERAPGGSSGGSAAAVAAGLAPLTTASDGGGSIRIPASLCGVFGIKPTFGSIPFGPKGIGVVNTIGHLGPITRTAADSAAMLDVMAGPDERDRGSIPKPASLLDAVNQEFKPGKIGFATEFAGIPVRPDVRECFEQTLSKLESAGWTLEEVDPQIDRALEALGTIITFEWGTSPMEISQNDPEHFELHTDYVKNVVANRKQVSLEQVWEANRIRKNVVIAMGRFFEAYDLFLSPTVPRDAFLAGEPFPAHPDNPDERDMTLNGLVGPFNLTGDPACTMPMGLSQDGLPLGLQIVAPRYEDARVLQAAHAAEPILDSTSLRPNQ
jgi:Asp-tRNA(Asn)/Glu-tRNA(Gln) amidotransferase A subunit family amidase